jgi:hypothetical protein
MNDDKRAQGSGIAKQAPLDGEFLPSILWSKIKSAGEPEKAEMAFAFYRRGKKKLRS